MWHLGVFVVLCVAVPALAVDCIAYDPVGALPPLDVSGFTLPVNSTTDYLAYDSPGGNWRYRANFNVCGPTYMRYSYCPTISGICIFDAFASDWYMGVYANTTLERTAAGAIVRMWGEIRELCTVGQNRAEINIICDDSLTSYVPAFVSYAAVPTCVLKVEVRGPCPSPPPPPQVNCTVANGAVPWPVARGGSEGWGQTVHALPEQCSLNVRTSAAQPADSPVVDLNDVTYVSTASGVLVISAQGSPLTLIRIPTGSSLISNLLALEDTVVVALATGNSTGLAFYGVDDWQPVTPTLTVTGSTGRTAILTQVVQVGTDVVIGSVDFVLFAAQPSSLAWTVQADGVITALAVSADGGTVYASTASSLYSVAITGLVAWRVDAVRPSNLITGPWNTVLYGTTGAVVAVAGGTGLEAWRLTGDAVCSSLLSLPAGCGWLVCVQQNSVSQWSLIGVNLETGLRVWTTPLAGEYMSPQDLVVGSNGTGVYLASDTETTEVGAFNTTTGALLWRTSTAGSGGRLAVTSTGTVAALVYNGANSFLYYFDHTQTPDSCQPQGLLGAVHATKGSASVALKNNTINATLGRASAGTSTMSPAGIPGSKKVVAK